MQIRGKIQNAFRSLLQIFLSVVAAIIFALSGLFIAAQIPGPYYYFVLLVVAFLIYRCVRSARNGYQALTHGDW